MTRKFSTSTALAAAVFALLVGAERAVAQMAEPQRAPENVIAPAGAGAPVDTGLAGAAPVPDEPGPLGEPAPPAVMGEVTLEVAAEGPAEGTVETGLVETGVVETGVVETGVVEDAGPIGATLLGEPVAAPTRRSFLPAIRTEARLDAVPAVGAGSGLTGTAFVDDQLTHERVVDAQLDAKFDLKALFAERGLSYPPRDLYFRLFKQEQVLEVWVRDTPTADTYTLLREYPICAIPGRLGPKTRTDDFQAPEGFYYIEGFNPESDFHLSLRLNYPNPADRIIGVEHSWGGDIYIHGGCSTVGCFPMTDEVIAELYWLAVEARGAGQNVIPVHVFPARLDEPMMRWLRTTFERDARLLAFWDNLREGYQLFETTRRVPVVTVDPAGRYLFADAAANATLPGAEDGLLGAPVQALPVESPVGGPLGAPAEPLSEPEPEPAPASEPEAGPLGEPAESGAAAEAPL